LFLVFLDCVHQLQVQFPAAFQFSDLYLTVLWDSACLGLFENFVFNCDRERHFSGPQYPTFSRKEEPKTMASAWDWSIQFDESSLSLFNNPLNLTHVQLRSELGQALKDSASVSNNMRKMTLSRSLRLSDNVATLTPVTQVVALKFWSTCYMRWLTPVQIIAGGAPSEYLTQCILVEEIVHLQHRLATLKQATPPTGSERRRSELIFSHAVVPTTPKTPNVTNLDVVTSSFPFTPRRRGYESHVSFMGTPISLFLESSDVFNDTGELDDKELSAAAKTNT
jgi:myotubularin-related protein 10/11/12